MISNGVVTVSSGVPSQVWLFTRGAYRGNAEIRDVIKRLLLHEGQDLEELVPAVRRRRVAARPILGITRRVGTAAGRDGVRVTVVRPLGQKGIHVLEVDNTYANLLEIVGALGTARRLARRLHGGE